MSSCSRRAIADPAPNAGARNGACSANASVRKATRNKGHFPSDQAATL